MSGLAKKNEKVQLINAPKDILDTENMSEEESILPKKRKRVLETGDLVEILQRSLEKNYNVCSSKFDVKKQIELKGKVRGDLL